MVRSTVYSPPLPSDFQVYPKGADGVPGARDAGDDCGLREGEDAQGETAGARGAPRQGVRVCV